MAIITDQSYNPTITHNINIGQTSGDKAAFDYLCGYSDVRTVAFKLFKSGTGIQDDLVITVYNNSSGDPGVTSYGTVTIPKATINAQTNDTFYDYNLAFTGSVGTHYWYVISTAAADASNFVHFRLASSGGSNQMNHYYSGSWHKIDYNVALAPNVIKVNVDTSSPGNFFQLL